MAMNRFGRVGVLMGGPSSERQISLKSGQAVCAGLSQAGCENVAIDILSDDVKACRQQIAEAAIDCAFIALHGRFGEDGQIQQVLESMGIPYTGSGSSASRLAMDKEASRMLFEKAGLTVPRGVSLGRQEAAVISERVNDLGLPLVVKPVCGGSSIGLSIVESLSGLGPALQQAFDLDARVVVEEYVRGRELTVAILDDRALPVIEIIPKNRFFDFQAKYQPGMTEYKVPAELDTGVAAACQAAALAAHRALGCSGCSRVDLILDAANRIYVLELNNIPGMTQTSLLPKAARLEGMDFSGLCLRLLELAYEKK